MIRPTLSTQPQQAPLPRGRLPWTVLLPWAVAGAILVGTGVYAFVPTKIKSNPAAPGQSGELVWGDGLFTNALELQAWLRIRGVSYKTWAQRHPAGVKLLAPQPVALAPTQKAPAKTVKKIPLKTAKTRATPAQRSTEATPARTSAQADSSGRPSWLLPLLLVGAVLPAMVGFRVRSLGVYASLAFVAVALGFLVPLLLG